MATRRVNGFIYIPCPQCHRKLGPFTRLTAGRARCAHCGAVFNVRI